MEANGGEWRPSLTGCRKGEFLNLRWDQVDFEANELRPPDTKTGPRTISLAPEAAASRRSSSMPTGSGAGSPKRPTDGRAEGKRRPAPGQG